MAQFDPPRSPDTPYSMNGCPPSKHWMPHFRRGPGVPNERFLLVGAVERLKWDRSIYLKPVKALTV